MDGPVTEPTSAFAGGAPFVGRARELAALGEAFAEAQGGRGRLVLVSGEPGIGKTRLVEELARAAAEQGGAALWGGCWEGGGAPALWPWVQVLRAYAGSQPREAFLSALGGAADLAALVPELAVGMTAAPAPAMLDPDQARFRLFEAAATFLGHATAARPLLLVFDDLHGADADSLLMLRYAVRALRTARLLVVGTYREGALREVPTAARLIGELSREGTHVALGGLTEPEVAAFISEAVTRGTAVAAPPGPEWVQAVYGRTEGNPLFVDAVVRLCLAEGRFDRSDGAPLQGFSIPDQVRLAVRRRLASLPESVVATLTTAAVVGREFAVAVLERAAPAVTGAALLDQLAMAARAAVIGELPGVPGRYRFTHALLREVAYDDLPPSRRAALHDRVGRALEEVHGVELEAHVADIAYHCCAAASAGDVDRAVAFSERAAVRAAAQRAYGAAAEHRARAVEAFESHPSVGVDRATSGRRHCELLIALGEAHNDTGDRALARAVCQRALDLARPLGLSELFARAVVAYGGGWWGSTEVLQFESPEQDAFDDSFARLLEEALAMRGDCDRALRARLLSRLALQRYFAWPLARRAAATDEAVAVARALGDTDALAEVLVNKWAAVIAPGNERARLAIAREVIELGDNGGRPAALPAGLSSYAINLLELGECEEFPAAVARLEGHAERSRHLGALWAAGLLRAARALWEGRFGEVEGLAREALRIGRACQRPALLTFSLQMRALQIELGRRDELEGIAPFWRFGADRYPTMLSTRAAVAFLYRQLGQVAEARADFERAAAGDFVAGWLADPTWLATMTELAEVCVYLGDRPRAAILYDLLWPHARLNAMGAFSTFSYGAVARPLGMLATLLERWPEAEAHFELALERNRSLRAAPLTARTQVAYARMLGARGAAGDDARALAQVQAAFTAAHALGMRPLADEAAALRDQLAAAGAVAGVTDAAEFEWDTGSAGHTAALPSTLPAERIFRRFGEFWMVGYAEETLRLKHTKGLDYIAQLLRRAGEEIHAADLVSAAAGASGERPQAERARVNVTRAIAAVLKKMAEHHPTLARHLTESISTGMFCVYRDRDDAARWQL